MSVSISWARVTLGLCLLLLIICPRDKRPCSSTVANTSRDLVTMDSCKAMATAVGSQSMNPGSRHSLCLSSNVRRIVLWNIAFVVLISNIFLNQAFNKAQKIKKIISLIIPKCSVDLISNYFWKLNCYKSFFVTWYTFIYIARNDKILKFLGTFGNFISRCSTKSLKYGSKYL